tara:strand:- start:798 stop:1940 length:1143 start_codon:yes stop_codon:yes gene_type:complete
MNFKEINSFIKDLYPNNKFIPLHEPRFIGNEKKYLSEVIDSTFVSSVGKYVDELENKFSEFSNTEKSVAVVNGTSALQVALRLVGVEQGDEVLTQALTFIATSNAIIYNGASPIFLDVDLDTMGLSPKAVEKFLNQNCEINDDFCFNKLTKRRISACVPMHTFGFPVHMKELIEVCKRWKIPIVEDSAESLGSYYNGKLTGTIGDVGVYSLNGNKIITSGGGGIIVSKNKKLCEKAKFLTTTAKKPHPYDYVHDEIGYNFRMPNLNAALALAQFENLSNYLENKRELAKIYQTFFEKIGLKFRTENNNTKSNYWLMTIELKNKKERDLFLKETNNNNVMSRPIWNLNYKTNPYSKYYRDEQKNALFLEQRIINIPSSVRI